MNDVLGSDNERLLERLKLDDESAFERIVELYRPMVYYHAYNRLKRGEEARDLVQDIFVKVWKIRHRLPDYTCIKNLLLFLTKQHVIDLRRHWEVEKKSRDRLLKEASYIDGDKFLDNRTLGRQLAAAINSLPPKQQNVFRLIMFENKSHHEIVESLSLKPQTVKNTMSKALAALREKLAFIKKS
ncbi:RNA polymerase sigma factor [Chitinophaga ginsengisoli]|uniref:RNA polymerase sigma-70 factor (ECF subfamily) n=1 Tax=Chitinophaga ginsengisoli TaxID=363837 RepID=A0A2P8GQ74_9BACT|nr:sigma-70 family RNA polymerase sigma factor [Chitinophaga ginsengisoli]PSL36105.1 RNA polymerase sigma-70 factor (ECF subfamily) [Chitinophaga ginsengisoli]